ncbi:MAG: MFS transporter [Bryobacterales bacterium]|nr:MFS transporter [Bryobacterales bacterium]
MPLAAALPAARVSVLAVFFVHGAVFATWVSRIPEVQGGLGVSTGPFGLALLGVAVGSILSMPVTGWLIGRHGSKPVTAIASVWFCLALAPLAYAGSVVTLGLALGFLGMAAGAMDVSMNAQGVEVETAARRPLVSGFHAMFSIGGMVGAGVGGVIAKMGIGVRGHFVGAGLLCLAAILLASRGLLASAVRPSGGKGGFRFTPAVAALAALTFCFFLSEGSIADWSALYLSRVLQAGPAQAAAGYALFSATMGVGRLAGDRLRVRYSGRALVCNGSLLAASGLALALLAPHTGVALAGFAMVGLGCSVIVPIAIAAAGTVPGVNAGQAISTVVTMGYLGLFVGPPLIGMAAEAITLRWAMMITVALCLCGVPLSRLVESADRE